MKKIEENEYKYKTLYPDSIVSKKYSHYKRTNEELNSFLLNNFGVNYLNNNNNNIFLISSSQNKKRPIKRSSSSILKERPHTSRKSKALSLIESLMNENYISYNYYDNTKGRFQSAKSRNNKIVKQKFSKHLNNSKNVNDSKTHKSKYLSLATKSNSSKFNFFKSFSLFKSNTQKKKLIFDNNDSSNLNNFSFNNYIISPQSPLVNNSKNASTPQTPASSTRYKSKAKKNSLKSEYDSLILNKSIKKDSRKSALFSFDAQKRIQQHLKNNIIKNLNKRKLYSANIKLSKEQRKFHQKLFLDKLRSQVQSFEKSNDFYVDDLKLRSNLITPNKFQRNIFIKKVKRAAKHNDFFFKQYHFQSDKNKNIKHKRKKFKIRSLSPNPHLNGEKAKKLIKNIKNLQRKTKISLDYLKNLDFRLGTNKLRKIVGIVIPIEHKVRDVDEQYKDETVKYQKSIGNFIIYKGSGIYSSHLSSILRGDKIVAQAIKIEDL